MKRRVFFLSIIILILAVSCKNKKEVLKENIVKTHDQKGLKNDIVPLLDDLSKEDAEKYKLAKFITEKAKKEPNKEIFKEHMKDLQKEISKL